MNHTELANILQVAKATGIPVVLFGESGIGKTGFCRTLFSEAAILHDQEYESGGLTLLNSMLRSRSVVVFENLSEANLAKILPMIRNKSLFGDRINATMIFTHETPYAGAGEMIQLPFSIPTPEEWLGWAVDHTIHPIAMRLVAEYNALERLRPRDLENLSKLLNAGLPDELIEPLLAPYVQAAPELLELIQREYSEAIDFESVISLDNQAFIDRIKQSSAQNIDRFNTSLLQEIKFDESIISKEKLISYLGALNTKNGLELLSGLLENEASETYLGELLNDPSIQRRIDEMVERG